MHILYVDQSDSFYNNITYSHHLYTVIKLYHAYRALYAFDIKSEIIDTVKRLDLTTFRYTDLTTFLYTDLTTFLHTDYHDRDNALDSRSK